MRETANVIAVGIGGTGIKVVSRLAEHSSETLTIALIDTDVSALDEAPPCTKVQIGKQITDGMGCGGDPAKGRRAAQSGSDAIRAMFSGKQLSVVAAGFGGGLGSGAVPVVLQAAREGGVRVVCFASLPFQAEGANRRAAALAAVHESTPLCNALAGVSGDALCASRENISLLDAFRTVQEELYTGVYSICGLTNQTNGLGADIAHLLALLDAGAGEAKFTCGRGEGAGKAEQALAALRARPSSASGGFLWSAAFVCAFGDNLTLREMNAIAEGMKEILPAGCRTSTAAIFDRNHRDSLTIASLLLGRATATPPSPAQKQSTASKAKIVQPQLNLEGQEGKFKGMDPTIEDDEDLDIPAYIRRGVKI